MQSVRLHLLLRHAHFSIELGLSWLFRQQFAHTQIETIQIA